LRSCSPPTNAVASYQKGGAVEWIHWQSGSAQLLLRLIAARPCGPLFLTDRKAPAHTPNLDICPATGRARLSYRRAEEIFEESTRLLANPLASPEGLRRPGGLDAPPAPPQRAHARRGRRHVHADDVGPHPPRLSTAPGAVRTSRRRRGRPARRRARPTCPPPSVNPGTQGFEIIPWPLLGLPRRSPLFDRTGHLGSHSGRGRPGGEEAQRVVRRGSGFRAVVHEELVRIAVQASRWESRVSEPTTGWQRVLLRNPAART
jgi:hypothetical protein